MKEQLVAGEIFTSTDADGNEYKAQKEYCKIQGIRTAIYRLYRNSTVIVRATDCRFVLSTMAQISADWTSNNRSYNGVF